MVQHQGARYEVRESEWPTFIAGLRRQFTAQVVAPLERRMDSARFLYEAMVRLNNDQWAVAWVLEATRTGINLDEVTGPIREGQAAMERLRSSLPGPDLKRSEDAAREAERAVERAYRLIREYRDLQIGSGERAVTALQVTSTVCFTIFALAGGAVLAAPAAAGGLGMGVVSSSAIMGGATSLLASASNVGGRAAAGEEIRAADLANVAIETVVGAAGGAAGGVIAARLGPHLAPAVARALVARGLFTGTATAVLVAEIGRVISGAGAGVVQGAIMDGVRVLRGQATMEQLLRNVALNLAAGAFVGFLAGRLPVRGSGHGEGEATGSRPPASSPQPSLPSPETSVAEGARPPARSAAPEAPATEPPVTEPPTSSRESRPTLPPGRPSAAPEPRLIDSSRPDFYAVSDSSNPRLQATGRVDSEGFLTMTIRAVVGGTRSTVIRGAEQFQRMLAHFGSQIRGIRGSWSYGTNLERVNTLTAQGIPLEQAAAQTWTGGQAASAGFTSVRVGHVEGSPGAYSKVEVLFTR